jgi:hypothetical protein
MRQERVSNGSIRSSALWGKPSKWESRSSALWGKGKGSLIALIVAAMVMVAPITATAGSGKSGSTGGKGGIKAYLSPGLLRAAQTNPNATFDVIVQGKRGNSSKDVASSVSKAKSQNRQGRRAPQALRLDRRRRGPAHGQADRRTRVTLGGHGHHLRLCCGSLRLLEQAAVGSRIRRRRGLVPDQRPRMPRRSRSSTPGWSRGGPTSAAGWSLK